MANDRDRDRSDEPTGVNDEEIAGRSDEGDDEDEFDEVDEMDEEDEDIE